jgi:hypothetical protein
MLKGIGGNAERMIVALLQSLWDGSRVGVLLSVANDCSVTMVPEECLPQGSFLPNLWLVGCLKSMLKIEGQARCRYTSSSGALRTRASSDSMHDPTLSRRWRSSQRGL